MGIDLLMVLFYVEKTYIILKCSLVYISIDLDTVWRLPNLQRQDNLKMLRSNIY